MSWRYKTEKKSCCSETLQCVHGKLAGASSSLIYDHYVDDIRTSTQLFSPMLMWISVCVAGSSKTRCFRILPRRKQNLGTRAQRDEILIASGEPSCFATLSRLTTNSTAPCWRTSTSLNLYHDLDISSFDLKHARSVTRINWRITPPPGRVLSAGEYCQSVSELISFTCISAHPTTDDTQLRQDDRKHCDVAAGLRQRTAPRHVDQQPGCGWHITHWLRGVSGSAFFQCHHLGNYMQIIYKLAVSPYKTQTTGTPGQLPYFIDDYLLSRTLRSSEKLTRYSLYGANVVLESLQRQRCFSLELTVI